MLLLSGGKAALLALALSVSIPAPVAADPVQSVLASINAARAKAGCGPLKLNKALTTAARQHASNMAEQNFFGHTGKDGRGFASRIRSQGYRYGLAAENIAAGQKTAERAVKVWLDSPGHRRNILNCKFQDTGIAMVYQPDDRPIRGQSAALRYYWVQLFGTPR
ncbi:MAG: CAP domain-containing protein [Tabrizicola sp.]|nr:CAP domain-containing protein [Tabrizicola sp.]